MIKRLECRAVSRMLWDYASQRLGGPDIECVERHLEKCNKCQDELEEYLAAISVVRSCRSLEPPESRATWSSLRMALEVERDIAARPARRSPARTFAFAGVAAAM